KALWAEDLDDQTDEDRIFGHAQAMGAEAVVIRTTSDRLATSMARFQAAGMKVYAWRWPAVVKNQGGRYAIDEANYVAQTLIPAGLDGYIVDPESENDEGYNDWNRTNLPIPVAQLATSFCQIIRSAAQTEGRPSFLFGITSGGNYQATLANLPWQQFVSASDAVFPQIYWRARNIHEVCKLVRDGTPGTNYGGFAKLARNCTRQTHHSDSGRDQLHPQSSGANGLRRARKSRKSRRHAFLCRRHARNTEPLCRD